MLSRTLKPIIVLLFIGFVCINTSNAQALQTQPTTLVLPKEFKQRMAQKPGIIIDVRTPGEFKKGAIDGAILLNIFDDDFEAELAKLNRDTTYYIYCAMGGRSAEAAEKMEKMGFKNIIDLDGGYTAWKKEGY
jgi:phage shock protein E